MKFGELKLLLDEEIQRHDLKHRYGQWINRGLRKIQQDTSWQCMSHVSEVVLPNGSSEVELPGDFKELTFEKTPVHMKIVDSVGTQYFPCKVQTFEQLTAQNAHVLYPYSQTTVRTQQIGLPVYISPNGVTARWFLNIVEEADADLTFRVSYYRYLPELADDDDENFFTRNYEEMVEAVVKKIGFTAINDPIAASFEALYQKEFSTAHNHDQRRKYSGRTLRMGGD